MNAWRRELRELLDRTPCARPAALRRSGAEGMLYATDLPRCAAPEETARFLGRAKAAGWEGYENADWIHLSRPVITPPEGWEQRAPGPEARCCRSLLLRHEDQLGPAENGMLTELVKAGEEGPAAHERLCARLHREWAARLREGKALPETDLRFFGAETAPRTEHGRDPEKTIPRNIQAVPAIGTEPCF